MLNKRRVLSGMRPTGLLHLGHYHGVLKNWVQLQHEYECFFFVADWHALTTHYDSTSSIAKATWDMVIDWLACGVNAGSATLFVQSRVPQHAELYLLLSMITPLSWLERVPSYKDQQEKLKEKDLSTYGFLGYPLLQSADILAYYAGLVPVGADQVSHVELTREVARRFNFLYGREEGFEQSVQNALRMMGKKTAQLYEELRNRYQEQGDEEALSTGRALIEEQSSITFSDKERLFGYLEGSGKIILQEPQALLTPESKMPGLDGQKMSKSYGNTITLRETPDQIDKKIRLMPTDPARVRRTDAGDPKNCAVWSFHEIYSDQATKSWVEQGCKTAAIGCVDCKKKVIEAVQAEIEPICKRAKEFEEQPEMVRALIDEGSERAAEAAEVTLHKVRQAMGLTAGQGR